MNLIYHQIDNETTTPDIVSNNRKNTKVKDIVKYFKNKENLENARKQINETINLNIYDEPISHNKLFWDSGNNYFINNLLTDFVKMLQAIPMQTAISVAE